MIRINTSRLHIDTNEIVIRISSMREEVQMIRQCVKDLDMMWDASFHQELDELEMMLDELDELPAFAANAKNNYEACERKVEKLVASINL